MLLGFYPINLEKIKKTFIFKPYSKLKQKIEINEIEENGYHKEGAFKTKKQARSHTHTRARSHTHTHARVYILPVVSYNVVVMKA